MLGDGDGDLVKFDQQPKAYENACMLTVGGMIEHGMAWQDVALIDETRRDVKGGCM